MTSKEAIFRLHERGWSTNQIAAALGRNRGQIVQIEKGRKPGRLLEPFLGALTKRKAPAPRTRPKPARGSARPKPAPASTGVRAPGKRVQVGRGETARRVSTGKGLAGIRSELLYHQGRRVRLTLQIKVNGRRVNLSPWKSGIQAQTLHDLMADPDTALGWLAEHEDTFRMTTR